MDKVICPYCGAEMFYFERRTNGYGVMGYYLCRACESRAPRVDNIGIDAADMKAAAYAAAMRRYVEPNRVLTFEEIMNLDPDGTTCVEKRRTGAIEVILNFEILEGFAEVLRDGGQDAVKKAHGHSYGRFSRAWLRRPTDDERASMPWTQTDT